MCLVIRHVPLHAVLATLKLHACQECTCVWSRILSSNLDKIIDNI